jgi:glucose-induced degradation protein 8
LIRVTLEQPGADLQPALSFATTHLAPRASQNEDFKNDLELTMSLLIFPSDNLSAPLKAIIDPSLRKTVANKVNEAILSSQGAKRHARLRHLVRMRAWSEATARQKDFFGSTSLDIGLDDDADPVSSVRMAEQVDSPMSGADVMVS